MAESSIGSFSDVAREISFGAVQPWHVEQPHQSNVSWGADNKAPTLAAAGAVINSNLNNRDFYGSSVMDRMMAGIKQGVGYNHVGDTV